MIEQRQHHSFLLAGSMLESRMELNRYIVTILMVFTFQAYLTFLVLQYARKTAAASICLTG